MTVEGTGARRAMVRPDSRNHPRRRTRSTARSGHLAVRWVVSGKRIRTTLRAVPAHLFGLPVEGL